MLIKQTIIYGIIAVIVLAFLWLRPVVSIAPQVKSISATSVNASEPESNDHNAAATQPKVSTQLPGIDVSHYQGRVAWQSVKAAGISFAYLKATDGVTYLDPHYENNATTLKKMGMTFGAYHFFEPKDDPIAQAKHYLSRVTFSKGSLPPVLDIEITGQFKPEQIRSGVMRWLEYVEQKTGCKPMIYTYADFWNTNLGNELIAYPLWLADYNSILKLPKGVNAWHFWQHSQKGRVSGIDLSVDLNWFNGNEATLKQFTCKV